MQIDVADVDPLERARLRARILREANARLVSSRARRAPWLALAAVVVAAAAVVWFIRERPRPAPIAVAPKFDVATNDGAVWRTHTDGAVATIELIDGTATFVVPHLEPAQRFLVTLPDGEVEVRGTRFDVVVSSGSTRSVTVREGRVVLRRLGEDELVLRAGDHWSRIDAPPVDSVPAAPTLSASTRRPRAPAAPSSATRFEEAMAAFRSADYARADSLFARFAAEFPADARCEDAAFLRAVARSRVGDKDGAASLARAYLAAYPTGLRRVEAQRLVDAAR